MKVKILCLFFICLLNISCTQSIKYKEIEVIIENNHPFDRECENLFWYSICYTDGYGDLKYIHLNQGLKKIKLIVQRDKPIFICAKALGFLSPIGGVILPDENKIVLDYEKGYLVSFLQKLYIQNPSAILSLKFNKIFTLLKKRGILNSFNKLILARDIISEDLCEKSIYSVDNIKVSLDQAINGYWISENPNEGGFLISDSNYKRIKLSLSEGTHYYLNIEKNYLMIIIVDTINKKYFTRIEKAPMEIK